MNKQFTEALFEDGLPDLDMMLFLMGQHCWCGHHTQNLHMYNLYDVYMGH